MSPFSNKEKTRQTFQGKFLATSFIFNSDQQRYNTLLWDIKNYNLKGMDVYPDTANEAIYIMNNYNATPAAGTSGRHTTQTSSGSQF